MRCLFQQCHTFQISRQTVKIDLSNTTYTQGVVRNGLEECDQDFCGGVGRCQLEDGADRELFSASCPTSPTSHLPFFTLGLPPPPSPPSLATCLSSSPPFQPFPPPPWPRGPCKAWKRRLGKHRGIATRTCGELLLSWSSSFPFKLRCWVRGACYMWRVSELR